MQIVLDPDEEMYRTKLQKEYSGTPFAFGEVRSNMETGLPDPAWTIALVSDLTLTATKNDPAIVRFPADLARKVNALTAAEAAALIDPLLDWGIDLAPWLSGTDTIREMLTHLGQQINPDFDPANYTI